MREKERTVVYLNPVTIERLELIRGWLGARSRGAAIDAVTQRFIEEFEDDILSWASAQFQQEGGK